MSCQGKCFHKRRSSLSGDFASTMMVPDRIPPGANTQRAGIKPYVSVWISSFQPMIEAASSRMKEHRARGAIHVGSLDYPSAMHVKWKPPGQRLS